MAGHDPLMVRGRNQERTRSVGRVKRGGAKQFSGIVEMVQGSGLHE